MLITSGDLPGRNYEVLGFVESEKGKIGLGFLKKKRWIVISNAFLAKYLNSTQFFTQRTECPFALKLMLMLTLAEPVKRAR